MGWNEPDKDKDPWSGKNQPPDLDEALKRLQDKLKKTFLRNSSPPESGDDNRSNGKFLALIIFFVAFAIWALSGIFIVDPAEQAAILRFGKYVETVGPGPHWIPRLISSKIIVNIDRVADYSYSGQMLTKDENLVSVAIAVQYRIGDLQEYLFNVADPEESLKQATSSALRQVVGQTTLDQMITEGREAWGNSVQDTLVKILAGYKTGIAIVNVSPQPARAPENVQDAFDDAIKAQEDEKRFKDQARAYEARVVPIAEGNAQRIQAEATAYAEQVVLKAQGETAEFLELLPQYSRSPYVTSERMYLEAMQQVLSRSTKIIVDNKAGNLLYLPLEKLFSQNNQPNTAENSKPEATVANATQGEAGGGDLFDGRETIRPTERLGRSE
ncbi:protease subunit HflK (plasmid) [Legionella adelaidensis]|uniref:Protein HflK n=1 Tax=Legionella adelaidensis TaxID=45056 RepID=A0A0W0R2X4_9GAMM|nr:FtsH protease activity modulator HflK [Legionella adelaidensis]KTC65387.1 protease subunit HflK [Legionella adelaidensis]VEH84791.1 protease subunit HflK [Legionella adelaidensis]